MDFNFLPQLPKSDLDDRTFKDLVDECILRIPRYCPEWTNFNPGDPGITLVELFAWLSDQMMLRFNQVPRRNYVTFLEMLGIRLQPAVPAQTELTFYLSSTQANDYEIAPGVEVATVRTENQEAIVFSTEKLLTIGKPEITHFLTASTAAQKLESNLNSGIAVLNDRLTNIWTQNHENGWEGRAQSIFAEQPQPGNCFYLVFGAEQNLAGNVLAIKLKGEAATSTGINPDYPPRRWEAWNGEFWQPILLQETDDGTNGFSFRDTEQPIPNSVAEGEVILHLPLELPVTYFSSYQGRWLRCVYIPPNGVQSGFLRSPELLGISARAVGGTVRASQCSLVEDEFLGKSDGNPGQRFQLQHTSILPRESDENLLVIPPGGLPEIWEEVNDFAESAPNDRHYILDSLTGEIQFGPLIREPRQIREQIKVRAKMQVAGANTLQVQEEAAAMHLMERQYGAIPPKASQIRMVRYRHGGGKKGNVQSHTLQIPKTAIPYVERVTNHINARNGIDAESLEDAVLRVPKLLRTRDRAVTPEDFENLALQAGGGAVARAYCPPMSNHHSRRGMVELLIVPQVNTEGVHRGEGVDPNEFALNSVLEKQILSYLDERRLLGVEVRLQQPEYVGVSVQAEVGLEPEYNHPQAQQTIIQNLLMSLYRFLNPLTGGYEGKGWNFGASVYTSDIVSLFQNTIGVRYLGAILLFELRFSNSVWNRTLAPNGVVNPGSLGLICSWNNSSLRSFHAISLV
ncbi:MAG: putative baseplate assembly protein [Cyanobacteria bacterium P01_A01_bin.80]